MKNTVDSIFDSFQINEGYRYTNSFLQSVLDVMPDVTQTLLREHYRCHPKIINFCNQKFYRGELIIMTTDRGEQDVLSVVKTVVGNHARDHYSQRQIDVIKNEILPKYAPDPQETGIISPYKNQVEALRKEITDIDAATVHKFQGKEKDNIIISTVDDEISDFADDPYLINVAVSRAKKKLMLVVTGNEQPKERNITDLIDYIQYHNFEVTESKTYSVFDYLYTQYTKERIEYLKKHKKILEFDSENLMYSLIEEIIADNKYSFFEVVCHFPLSTLIRDTQLLKEQEDRYVKNSSTHLDFLIYNRRKTKEGTMGFFGFGKKNKEKEQEKMKTGLEKTRTGFWGNILNTLTGSVIDDDMYDELEEQLILADVGGEVAVRLVDKLRDRVHKKGLKTGEEAADALRDIIAEEMTPDAEMDLSGKPAVILVIGVNGVGKTTSIAKLADHYTREGKKVMLAAGDTFRAAASEQLEIWADRAGVPIVSAGEGADPAAVIFDTVKSATARGYDMVIADTAGRLHNKANLMAELSKISRSVKKASPEASLETLLVLDAITGQNAISQAKEFCKAADATGIILTKLDGTAKGGCVVAVKQRLGLPVRFIGVGEGIDDLLPFTPEGFVEELLPRQWKH